VTGAWQRESQNTLMSKLKNCTEDLEEWGARIRRRFTSRIKEYREEMERNREYQTEAGMLKYQDARQKLSIVLKQEEDYWKQRSKTHWLRDGDSNIRFFHAAASARKKKNHISKLNSGDGEIVQDQSGKCKIAKDYFEDLFQQGDYGREEVTPLISNRVTNEDNHELTKEFVAEEFKEAIFNTHSDKAPGPDGLNPAFYKRFWDPCGSEIFEANKQWLLQGRFPDDLNNTNIVLIPKVDNPTFMKDLRLISLCNVLYKIVSKVLANRLKPFLTRYISFEQSAFCRE
jgi:hypothetical protein